MNAPAAPTAPHAPVHVLVVEDDDKIADLLLAYLHAQGWTTQRCIDGRDAVALVRARRPSLVLLDLMLPGLDGLQVCEQVRAFSDVPLIMLTARVDEIDRLLGLEHGADDYICKPFSPREVVARMKALLRRSQGAVLAPGGLRVREERQQIDHAGQPLPLTAVEYRLLRMLLSRPGEVFGRARLLEGMYDDWRDVSDRVIDSHVKNLRRKLEQAGAHEVTLASVYGVGYRIEAA